jgi:transposase
MMRVRASADPIASARGAPWLKTTLVQCAWAAVRKKDSYFCAQFHRIRARRGAVAASILTAINHVLKNGTMYPDLGSDHFNRRCKDQQTHHLSSASARSSAEGLVSL